MPVEISDQQYGVALHNLRKIATGGEVLGDRWHRLTKEEMINLAREICDSWHMPYGRKDTLGRYKADLAGLEQSVKNQ